MRLVTLPALPILFGLALTACSGGGAPAPGATALEEPAGPADVDPSGTALAAPPAERELPEGVTVLEPGVPGDPMGVRAYRLANGLTVMLSENHEQPRIQTWITTRAGSNKDPADATGMAHYLEHMHFKGTPELGTLDWEQERVHLDEITRLYDELFVTTDPAARAELYRKIDEHNQAASRFAVPNEFDRLYDAIGASGLNAFTNAEQTSYLVDLPSNRLATWAKLESDRFANPVYRLFQTEIEAVYEEKNRSLDNKDRAVWEALMESLYPEHPFGTQPTIGTVEHLKNPSVSKMYEYHRTWYVPENMVVALSGDFDTAEALAVVAEHFGKWESRACPEDPQHPLPPPEGVKRVQVPFEAEEEVMIAYLTVPRQHADRDALVLCDMMLSNSRTGLIDINLNQAQKVRSAGSSPRFMSESGFQILFAYPKPGQTLAEAEALLLEQVELLKQGRFTDEDLAAVITDFEISRKRELESNSSRVDAMTEAFLDRIPWSRKVNEIERLSRVTREQVVAAAAKYFGDDRVVIERVNRKPELPTIPKPAFTPVEIAADRHSPYFAKLLAEPVEPIEPHFVEAGRDYHVRELRSGELVWGGNPMNDLFELSFRIPVGTHHEPKLNMALALLDLAGAGDLDPVAFRRKLYALGTTLSAGAGRDETVVTLAGLQENLAESLALVREHFAAPTGVGQADLEQLVARAVGAREHQKQEARAINSALREYAMRGPDSGFLREPTNEQLAAYEAADLLAVAASVWKYPRTAVYVGPAKVEEVAAAVDLPPLGATLDDLAPVPARPEDVWVRPAAPRVLFVDKQAAQAQLGVFGPDAPYDPELVPLGRAYNEYMSGSMGSVVFQEIREARALAYDAWTHYRSPDDRGEANLLMGFVGTQADKTGDALEVLLGLVRDLPASESRFTNTMQAIDQSYRTNRIGFRQLPGVVVQWRRLGLEGDPRAWNWEQAKAMKLAELDGFAERFAKVPFTITVVGDRSRIDLERLGTFGKVEELAPDQLFAW